MKLCAIRGATTIESDNKELIKAETLRLFDNIVSSNKLKEKQIISVIIGTTCDIKSFYPATALRLSGKCNAPLFSTTEPYIENSLKLCIRILIHAYHKKPVHVYLNNAENLKIKQNEVKNLK